MPQTLLSLERGRTQAGGVKLGRRQEGSQKKKVAAKDQGVYKVKKKKRGKKNPFLSRTMRSEKGPCLFFV